MQIDPNSIKKILVVQIRPFGDVLLATSYLEALTKRYPDATIDFFVSAPFDQVLHNHPLLSSIIVSPKKDALLPYLWGRLRAIVKVFCNRYDLVIDQQAGTGSAYITLFSAAKYRLGWNSARGRCCYNLKAVPGVMRYHACWNFGMVAPLGIAEVPFKLYVTITQASYDYIDNWLQKNNLCAKEFICIAPGSAVQKKQWETASFLDVIRRIHETTGYSIVLTYSPSEKPVAQYLADNSNNAARMSPPTTYNQVAAMLSRSKMLICHDGGINHLSVATETPAIALFARASTAPWSPEGVFQHHYHIKKEMQLGDPTFGITPEDVYEKFEMLLAELQEQ